MSAWSVGFEAVNETLDVTDFVDLGQRVWQVQTIREMRPMPVQYHKLRVCKRNNGVEKVDSIVHVESVRSLEHR